MEITIFGTYTYLKEAQYEKLIDVDLKILEEELISWKQYCKNSQYRTFDETEMRDIIYDIIYNMKYNYDVYPNEYHEIIETDINYDPIIEHFKYLLDE